MLVINKLYLCKRSPIIVIGSARVAVALTIFVVQEIIESTYCTCTTSKYCTLSRDKASDTKKCLFVLHMTASVPEA